jgi:8-oxo-dGTP pyrophosphatase MutT (NUDIX family)
MDSPQPKKHGVVAVLQDADGRYLFIKRGLTLVRAPGYWCFVGGEVDPGETHELAIVREVSEEVGLDVSAVEKIHETISPNGEYRLHWIRVTIKDSAQALNLHQIEVAEARWLTPNEAVQLDPILPTLKTWLAERLSH